MTKAAESTTATPAVKSNTPFFNKGEGSALSLVQDASDTFFSKAPAIQAKLTVNEPGDVHEQEADAVADKVVQSKPAEEVMPAISSIQAKLTVNEPNDAFEQEADAVADKAVEPQTGGKDTTPISSIQAKCNTCEQEELQKKEEENEPEAQPELQRQPAADALPEPPPPSDDTPAAATVSSIQMKCAGCAAEEKEQAVQTKSIFESNEHPLQRKCTECAAEEKEQSVQAKSIFESNEHPLQRKCAGCAAEEKEEAVQRAPVDNSITPLAGCVTNTSLQAKPIFESNQEPEPAAAMPRGVQTKLSINEPGDTYEQEADAVADKVVQKLNEPGTAGNASGIQAKPATGEEEELQKKEEEEIPEATVQKKCTACGGDEEEKVQRIQAKPIFESNAEIAAPMVQRRCRECEEGDKVKVFLKPISMLQLASNGTPQSDGSRDSIIAAARTKLGKIEAKHNDGSGKRVGASHLLEIFHLAAPGVWDDSIIETAGAAMPSWCGIFSVWAHKKAGKDIGTWQMGRGVSAFGKLTPTTSPQPGDIGYIDQPCQHHCIVVKVDGGNVHSIDGNSGLFSEVIENVRPMSIFTGFFTAFGAGSGVQRKEEATIQKAENNGAGTAASSIEGKLAASKTSGDPLPEEVRGKMESSIGADFSNVKIHTDSSAVQMSKDLNAQAFTHENHIYFNSGKFNAGSQSGQHLLAHELTHTIQQGKSLQLSRIQRSPAGDMISSHTTLGFLDEAALGSELADGLPDNSGTVESVLNELGGSDRDDVAYETVTAAGAKGKPIPDSVRIRFIQELVTGVVTDEEEKMIADLWLFYGVSLPDNAEKHRDLWQKSLWESDDLEESTQGIRDAFKKDVEALALRYLVENKNTLDEEAGRFGVNLNSSETIQERDGYVESVMAIAPMIVKLQKYMEELKGIQVGYNTVSDCLFGDCKAAAYFNPDYKPQFGPEKTESPPIPTWEQTKEHYERTRAVIGSFAGIYPSIYILIQQGKLESFAQAKDVAEAKAEMTKAFKKTDEKITEAISKVNGPDIEYYDLPMLQEQLVNGKSNEYMASTYDWKRGYYADIAADSVKSHEARQFWVDMGLSLVAAAALIAAPFTGGATAAFLVSFGIGIGAGQAGLSWDKYSSLSTVEGAGTKEELELVSEGQVTAQLVDAIIQTVATFLDVYGAKSAATASKATRASLEAAEKEVKQALAAEAKAKALKEAGKDAALTLGGAGVAIGLHQLAENEPVPQFAAAVEQRSITLPADEGPPASGGSTVNRMVIQLAGGGGGTPTPGPGSATPAPIQLTGTEFELYVERGLREGTIGGVPKMSFVIPGQYTGSGWGIDRIGILVDDAGNVSVFHFEMKFVTEGSPHVPGLGVRAAGTQTGEAWTRKAVDGLLDSQHPMARAAKERLRRALQKMHPGEYIDINRMRTFLHGELINAPVHIVVPDYADLSKIYKQVAALVRWGREARVVKVAIPK